MAREILEFLKSKGFKRLLIFSVLLFLLYLVRSVINIILLTFIFSFLMHGLVRFIRKKIPLDWRILVLIVYGVVISALTYGIAKYFPVLINEIRVLFSQLTNFLLNLHQSDNQVFSYIGELIYDLEVANYLDLGLVFLLNSLNNVGTFGLQLFIAIILSLFFLLEKNRIIQFTKKFKNSRIAPFYEELEYFGRKFVNTFGKVIEAQFIIALVNSLITTLFLYLFGFPNLFGLAIMVFFLGLIPVAGVIISLIPLSIIAYTIGGIIKVIYIWIMVAIVHAVEAYFLNPKIMSSKTNLPVFYTFIILILGEHFFGVWGLILGIPIFIFILDVMGIQTVESSPGDGSGEGKIMEGGRMLEEES